MLHKVCFGVYFCMVTDNSFFSVCIASIIRAPYLMDVVTVDPQCKLWHVPLMGPLNHYPEFHDPKPSYTTQWWQLIPSPTFAQLN